MSRRRVVVTGFGAVTPLGHSAEATWKAMKEGQSGVDWITIFDATTFPTKIAAEVKGFKLADFGFDLREWGRLGRNAGFALAAAKEAMAAAGLAGGGGNPLRRGVYLGAGEGGQDFDTFIRLLAASWNPVAREPDEAQFIARALRTLDPVAELEQEPGMAGSHLAALFDCQGPNLNTLTACAASAQALGEAAAIIRRDDADVMLTGGCHSMIHPLGVTGFNKLTALSTNNDPPQKASRPFDATRNGFVLGEGAGMLVLEELEHARRRGAAIHGEVVGYGTTADAFRLTDTHDEGRGAIACLKMALADARLNPTDLHYINAHGTSTSVNDRIESLAIRQVFGAHADHLPVSSTKSMSGHLIAAGGAVEAIACLLALRDQVAPPTINYEHPDPECDLDYVPNQARPMKLRNVISNSFGFGGQNISVALSKFAG